MDLIEVNYKKPNRLLMELQRLHWKLQILTYVANVFLVIAMLGLLGAWVWTLLK